MLQRCAQAMLVLAAFGLCACFPAQQPAAEASAKLRLAPVVTAEIAAGYDAYREILAPWGTWERHAAYGVCWLPPAASPNTFQPYVDRGHWDASDDASQPASAGEADGPPTWISEDAD